MSESHDSSAPALKISAWAIRNPVPVVVLFVALVLAGMIAYTGLPVKQFPNVQFPMVSVTVTQNGAAPGEMETQVTRPVEDAMAGLSSVKNITSVVTQGVSTTNIEFELGEDLQKKTDDVRSRVDQVRANLPREIDAPTVTRVELDSQPILTYAVAAPGMSDTELSWFIDDTVARAIQSAPGVSQISRVGGVNREINVLVDPDRLAARGLTAAQVNSALASFDIDASGGRVNVGSREQTVRVLGSVQTLAALRQLTIPVGANRFVRLTDVADVGDGAGEVRGFARLDGRPVVGFQVMKTRDSSDVGVDDAVVVAIAKLEKSHPGVKFTKIFSSVDETRASFKATQHVLAEGMILAALVVLLFLRDWRATAITAAAMPVSLIPTFAVMHAFGFSLNVVTLLALTLVIGILVDDAIVEIENIEKRVASGMRPYEAAMQGADAIGLAVVATTMTIIVVFTPVSFMKGMAGQFFREFGLTVSVAVAFSLVVARLLTPLMAAYLLKPHRNPHPRKPFQGFYRNVLEWALDHRIIASVVGGLVFVSSLFLVPLLPKGFQPAGNPDYVYVNIQGPPGATAQAMEQTVQEITRLFQRQSEVTSIFAQVGSTAGGGGPGFGGGGGGSDLRDGTVTVLLDPKRKLSDEAFKARLRDDLRAIPDARVGFLDFQGGAGFQQILASDNPAALQATATELEREMRTLPQIADPRPSTPPTGPELVIRPRAEEAARLGVSVDTIAQVARVATVGDIDANVAKLNEGERRIPIRVRLPQSARADIERIRSLRVPTAGGGVTTLDSVADVQFQAGPARIDRLNRKRQLTVQAELNGVELGDASAAVAKLPIMRRLPPGVGPADTGQLEAMKELFGSFGMAIFAGVSMIFGVLVLLFRSFFKPGVILSALPLAVGGAFLGLLIFHLSLSIPSLIGFLMLLGLAAKNSILLVEYAIEREREGMPQREALLEACRERARPIVMTTVAMAAGMLPTAFALEKGAEFRQPMAVAVIGGLITSTLLSLVLVPVVYEFVDDFEQWLKPRLAKLVTPREAAPLPVPEDRL
ncbi:AcrB/AcrD/AcrF family protein [Phenylobacterium hankyongense]|uniref:AcrB/AcrD/AcrF family protein n=1 Tax=Phenylobacterium hankyongense TaxID=1813876 RepID=A0A328B052_9CAUL|nr:efflux RND transporter permease subunit [Phenylobacterium hankyongense]RAK59925.1 AcrB/AcrD/AcrF family protein [Phenylobacterium hankyongense]